MLPAPSERDWLAAARRALDHIGLQGPTGVLLGAVWPAVRCNDPTLQQHVWTLLRKHAELQFFSEAEEADWRSWKDVDSGAALDAEQLATLSLEEAAEVRAVCSRRLHAKALGALEHYEKLFDAKGAAGEQWRALNAIGRAGAAGVLQKDMVPLLNTPSKHLFYALSVRTPPRSSGLEPPVHRHSGGTFPLRVHDNQCLPPDRTPPPGPVPPFSQVLQRLGLVIKEERKIQNPHAHPAVTVTSLVRLSRFQPSGRRCRGAATRSGRHRRAACVGTGGGGEGGANAPRHARNAA